MNKPDQLTTNSSQPVSAPIWQRLAAAIYDVLPLLALWFVAGALAQALTAGTFDTHRSAHKLLLQILLIVPTAAYFILSWLRGGQTIGMRAWRLRVVSSDAVALTPARAALRFGVAVVSLLAVGIGFAWILIDPQRRAWHDIAARTRVVRANKAMSTST